MGNNRTWKKNNEGRSGATARPAGARTGEEGGVFVVMLRKVGEPQTLCLGAFSITKCPAIRLGVGIHRRICGSYAFFMVGYATLGFLVLVRVGSFRTLGAT